MKLEHPQHLSFQSYSPADLQAIIDARFDEMRTLLSGRLIVEPRVSEVVSRKVVADSSDVRRALNMCHRAVVLAAQGWTSSQEAPLTVRLASVLSAGNTVVCQRVDALPLQQQLLLATALAETSFGATVADVHKVSHSSHPLSHAPALRCLWARCESDSSYWRWVRGVFVRTR
jgi:Cdc6-like AAA superfamily ATPase